MPTGASVVYSGRKILEQRGRAMTSPTESGCPPGFVFLGGYCVPATQGLQLGNLQRVAEKKQSSKRAAVAGRVARG